MPPKPVAHTFKKLCGLEHQSYLTPALNLHHARGRLRLLSGRLRVDGMFRMDIK